MSAGAGIPEQVNTDMLVSSVWFTLAAFMVFLAMLGLCIIDVGFVRKKHVLDTWIQKFVAMGAAGFGFAIFGYPIWMAQFNEAFGVVGPWKQAFHDWWIGGDLLNTIAANISWKTLPEADVLQIFFVFWLTYVMTCAVLMQGAFLERIKALPLAILCFFTGALIQPVLGYLLWGPVTPINNQGFHEFIGITSGYIVIGVFSLTINFFLKPRLGYFDDHPSGSKPVPSNFGFVGLGVIMLMIAVPFIAIGSGFIVPGVGFFGITFTTSGIGLVLTNVSIALAFGALSGVVIAYRRKEAIWALIGPIAGFIINAPMYDIEKPWHAAIWAVFGPPLVVLGYKLVMKMRVDDPKVAPLTILPGLAGSLIHGFVYWGTPIGGYLGITKGTYAFQQHVITPWWQLIGDVICVGVSVLSALVLGFILKKTIGLRKSERDELIGDEAIWGHGNFGEEPESVIEYGERLGTAPKAGQETVPAANPAGR